VIVAISTGLLVGLSLFGVSLPVDPPGRALPVWQDILAVGLVVPKMAMDSLAGRTAAARP